MKILPIIMSAPMIRALLEGRKTQTRRTINPRKYGRDLVHLGKWEDDDYRNYYTGDDNDPHSWGWPYIVEFDPLTLAEAAKFGNNPFGKLGDLLWVREAAFVGDDGTAIYRADYDKTPICTVEGKTAKFAWTPSIFMPRHASRLTLEITEVRSERLQQISNGDCRAEGYPPAYHKADHVENTHRGWYAELWETINGRGSWDKNPWVWVITFNVHQVNVDTFLKERVGAAENSTVPISKTKPKVRTCARCGCTDEDCRRCIERTGYACYWVADELCSACSGENLPAARGV